MKVRYSVICLFIASCICVSAQNWKLFSSERLQAAGKLQVVVMDFLERYYTQHKGLDPITLHTRLADDKVYFRYGSIDDLKQINDSMAFSINLVDRHYEAKWERNQLPFITIVFPAQYDLLFGMKQEEAQQRFKTLLTDSCQQIAKSKPSCSFCLTKDSILKYQSERFELEDLTNAVYYYPNDSIPVFDANHLNYSAANLFLGHIMETSHRMYVEQSVYGMKSVKYLITLNQWLNYCKEWNMKLYFGVEESREDGILAIVIAQSREFGFNHLLSVVIPDKFIVDKNCILKAKLIPYIPAQNVKELYSKESKNHKKIVWK